MGGESFASRGLSFPRRLQMRNGKPGRQTGANRRRWGGKPGGKPGRQTGAGQTGATPRAGGTAGQTGATPRAGGGKPGPHQGPGERRGKPGPHQGKPGPHQGRANRGHTKGRGNGKPERQTGATPTSFQRVSNEFGTRTICRSILTVKNCWTPNWFGEDGGNRSNGIALSEHCGEFRRAI